MTLPSTGKWAMSKGRDTWIEWFLKLSAVVVLQRKTKCAGPAGTDRAVGFPGVGREDAASSRGEPAEPSHEKG